MAAKKLHNTPQDALSLRLHFENWFVILKTFLRDEKMELRNKEDSNLMKPSWLAWKKDTMKFSLSSIIFVLILKQSELRWEAAD